ncbi:hypothetical protein BDV93DRAFT_558351 [Ceratobasidium sp. AG-I]|nr:hypothetical protein BDV93DRAFT_558351 [Ceratobasidium sp. AG-I]
MPDAGRMPAPARRNPRRRFTYHGLAPVTPSGCAPLLARSCALHMSDGTTTSMTSAEHTRFWSEIAHLGCIRAPCEFTPMPFLPIHASAQNPKPQARATSSQPPAPSTPAPLSPRAQFRHVRRHTPLTSTPPRPSYIFPSLLDTSLPRHLKIGVDVEPHSNLTSLSRAYICPPIGVAPEYNVTRSTAFASPVRDMSIRRSRRNTPHLPTPTAFFPTHPNASRPGFADRTLWPGTLRDALAALWHGSTDGWISGDLGVAVDGARGCG